MDIDLTYSCQLRYNESSPFCFLAIRSKKHVSDFFLITFINQRKMRKSRPLIFSMITYYTHVSIHTKRKFPGFIYFFWLHGQNKMFQTLYVKCANCRNMKITRPMSFNMNTYQIHLNTLAEN